MNHIPKFSGYVSMHIRMILRRISINGRSINLAKWEFARYLYQL